MDIFLVRHCFRPVGLAVRPHPRLLGNNQSFSPFVGASAVIRKGRRQVLFLPFPFSERRRQALFSPPPFSSAVIRKRRRSRLWRDSVPGRELRRDHNRDESSVGAAAKRCSRPWWDPLPGRERRRDRDERGSSWSSKGVAAWRGACWLSTRGCDGIARGPTGSSSSTWIHCAGERLR
ncbi:hypothetical protein BDA96_03G048700 [Sorghum bicolor]|uniref:Uncharacterized protein n=2 Tax=Sorghum bicolor TaxID=4558 RepID=A0A921RBD1_SORBI|nr:hypothetical protein BDA96_03G048700 [Sorghum bicolor]OQU86212.1 hypothetical protein SORBI_3003G045501 [Sorghum bicolor]